MKKTHVELETKEVVVVDAVICNKCGKTLRDSCYDPVLEIEASWGYGSKKDCTVQTAHICESCWDEFCGTFAVEISSFNYVNFEVTPAPPPEPQLSLFSSDELSGDPYQIYGVCGYTSPTEGYAPCRRKRFHEGPCAHPLKPQT